MSIDVEEFEMEVLMSNDWERYSPDFILVEQFVNSCKEAESHPTTVFLAEKGYCIVAKTFRSTLFKKMI